MSASANDTVAELKGRPFEFTAKIPLAEFDLGGVLYHGNYFRFYERAREEFLSQQHTSYADLITQGFHLAVTESSQKFSSPIYYGEEIKLELSSSEIKRTSVKLYYRLFRNSELIHQATTTHALVKSEAGKFKLARFPDTLKQAFINIVRD